MLPRISSTGGLPRKRPSVHHSLSLEEGKVLSMYFSYPQETTSSRRTPASIAFMSRFHGLAHHLWGKDLILPMLVRPPLRHLCRIGLDLLWKGLPFGTVVLPRIFVNRTFAWFPTSTWSRPAMACAAKTVTYQGIHPLAVPALLVAR